MCNTQVLEHTKFGYVARCNRCENLQLAFGTTSITLTEEQFHEFRETIRDYHLAYSYKDQPEIKDIYIPTELPSISLVFSFKELGFLMEMLEQASLSLEVHKVLS